jgi:hypothetical protein
MIINNIKVITGSFNFTENVMILDDINVANASFALEHT